MGRCRISFGWHHVQRSHSRQSRRSDRTCGACRSHRPRYQADAAARSHRSLHSEAVAHPAGRPSLAELALRLIDVVDDGDLRRGRRATAEHPGHAGGGAGTRLAAICHTRSAATTAHGGTRLSVTETSLDDDLGIFEPTPSWPHTHFAHRPRPRRTAGHDRLYRPAGNVLFRRLCGAQADPDESRCCRRAGRRAGAGKPTSCAIWNRPRSPAGAQEFTTLLQQSLGVSRALARRIVVDPLRRTVRRGRQGAGNAVGCVPAHPDVPQSGDRPVGGAGVRPLRPVPRTAAVIRTASGGDLAGGRPAGSARSLHRRTHWPDGGNDRVAASGCAGLAGRPTHSPVRTRRAAKTGADSGLTQRRALNAQPTTRSRKLRPCRSSTSTIQTSGSKSICLREIGFDLVVRPWLIAQARHEGAIDRPRVVEFGLRRRSEQIGGPVEPIDLHEDRTRLLRAAPAHDRIGAFHHAAADIGGDPDRRFQSHACD